MKAKHTKEFAEKLAYEKYPYAPTDKYRTSDTNESIRNKFIEGFMTAIEETNHIEVTEALKAMSEKYDSLMQEYQESRLLTGNESKYERNTGRIEICRQISNDLNEAIRKAEEELNQSKE